MTNIRKSFGNYIGYKTGRLIRENFECFGNVITLEIQEHQNIRSVIERKICPNFLRKKITRKK